MVLSRKAVRDMKEYTPPTSGRKGFLRLDFNENTVGCSPKVIEALRNINREELTVYPEYSSFLEKLSTFLGVKSSNVLLSNATDEAIKTIIETYIEKGVDEIVIPVPTFAMFKFYSQLNEAVIREVLYNEDLSFPVEGVLEAIHSQTKIVVIVNPNNPTGTAIDSENLLKVVKKAKKNDSIVLIDEAYYPFYPKSSIDLIEEYDNIIVTQTFSKAFGIANLRLGYMVSCPENINNLKKVISPYSVNGTAVICGSAAISDKEYVKRYVETISKNKEKVYSALDELDVNYFKSDANFILINAGSFCKKYCEKLKENGILVRDRSSDALLYGYFRVTIGDDEQTDKFIKVFSEIKNG